MGVGDLEGDLGARERGAMLVETTIAADADDVLHISVPQRGHQRHVAPKVRRDVSSGWMARMQIDPPSRRSTSVVYERGAVTLMLIFFLAACRNTPHGDCTPPASSQRGRVAPRPGGGGGR